MHVLHPGFFRQAYEVCFLLKKSSRLYIPVTALNQAFTRATGPPAATIPPTRLASAHSPITAPTVFMEIIAPLEISAWVLTDVFVLALLLALSLVVVFMADLLTMDSERINSYLSYLLYCDYRAN